MPLIAAGVKGQADVNSQPKAPTKFSRNLGNPATWSYIWTAGAFVYLVVTYFGIIRLSRIGN